jgi:hypothetical protein
MTFPILTLFKKGKAMSKIRGFTFSVLLVLAGVGGAARAGEKVLVPGDPPLTQDMVDDYCRYVAWRWPEAFARAGGPERLGQLAVNDWKNGDKARQRDILADLRWWRENYPKLAPGGRERLATSDSPPRPDPRQPSRNLEAIQLLRLQQWNDAAQLQIRGLSNLQSSHHETMMLIIDNMRPSGRYRYDPSTGR